MLSRRDFLQVSMAASSLYGASGFGNWAKLAAQQKLNQNKLLEFENFGNSTEDLQKKTDAMLKAVNEHTTRERQMSKAIKNMENVDS